MPRSSLKFGRPVWVVGLPLLVAIAGVGYWRMQREAGRPPASAQTAAPKRTDEVQVQTVATNTRRDLPSTAPDGTVRTAPKLPTLEAALGVDSGLAYAWRLEVVHSLGSGLAKEQVERLMAFVAAVRIPAGLTVDQVRALKNDVLNVLVAQKGSETALSGLLQRIHDDPAQEPGMRDYALQHLAALGQAADIDKQWQVATGKDPALAATAMLQLLSFWREDARAATEARNSDLLATRYSLLATSALKLAADTTQPETSRATALQVCGQLKHTEARSLAWDVARSPKASYPFRIAAIATLGDLGGGTATRDYLQQLATGREQRLRIPAESALKRFSIN